MSTDEPIELPGTPAAAEAAGEAAPADAQAPDTQEPPAEETSSEPAVQEAAAEITDTAGSGDAAVEAAPEADAPADEEAPADVTTPEAPRLAPDELRAIVEALIFASPEPLTIKTLVKLLADEPREDVHAAVNSLVERYQSGGGLHLVEVAGGYQITTRPELHEWVRRLFHERTTQKLSVQALETLAVIAYKQPITAAEIGEIRGVNTSGVLSTLMERHLIKIVGRKNVVGRPFMYGTTKEFLIRFGLRDLNDLPKVEDMAQALGFEAPAILTERPVTEDMLPLDEGDSDA